MYVCARRDKIGTLLRLTRESFRIRGSKKKNLFAKQDRERPSRIRDHSSSSSFIAYLIIVK